MENILIYYLNIFLNMVSKMFLKIKLKIMPKEDFTLVVFVKSLLVSLDAISSSLFLNSPREIFYRIALLKQYYQIRF